MFNYQKVFKGNGKAVFSILLFPLVFTVSLLAQPKDNAPYSRIGLGETLNQSLSAEGMAGLTATYSDPLHINLQNPASYGWLTAATFEAGFFAEHSTLKFSEQQSSIWSGNLSHLALAFPMRNPSSDLLAKKKRTVFWGMGLALLPNTSVGYDIQTQEVSPEVDTTLNIFQGTGGTNKLMWGNAVRYKNFSAGLNISYVFGQLESERRVIFYNLPVPYSNKFHDNLSIRGLRWTLGGQYQHNLSQRKDNETLLGSKSLLFGAHVTPGTSFSGRSTKLRIRENSTYLPIQSDTLLREEDVKTDGKLPLELALGVTYQQLGKLRLGVEYSYGGWSNYENEAKPETLFNSHRIAAGAEYIPDISSYNAYLKRVRYRLGFYHLSDPRLEDLSKYALTLGFGLPVILPRQQTSFVNFAFELGRYDTSDAIKETFVKIAIGFTLNDNSWFYKRKFG